MTPQDYIACLQGIATIAIIPMAVFLLLSHFGHRKRGRLAKWQAIGLSPHTDKWRALWSWDFLAGQYRGRNVTMSYRSDTGIMQVRISTAPPAETRLAIRPRTSFPGLGICIGRTRKRQARGIADEISASSHPPGLARQVMTIPGVRALLLADPKPEIELKGRELRLDRIGYFPEPRPAAALLDVLCAIAELIESQPARTRSTDQPEPPYAG